MRFLYKSMMLVGCIGFCVMWAQESFVTPKKKRISTSSLKQEIAGQLGKLAMLSAQAIGLLAQGQEHEFIPRGCELIEQDQESFFAKADGKKLQEYTAIIQKMVVDIEIFKQNLDTNFKRLHAFSQ